MQTKLSRSEWSSLEMPMSKDEFNNVNLSYNNTLVIQEFLKIQNSEEMNIYIYKTFIENFIIKLINKYLSIRLIFIIFILCIHSN